MINHLRKIYKRLRKKMFIYFKWLNFLQCLHLIWYLMKDKWTSTTKSETFYFQEFFLMKLNEMTARQQEALYWPTFEYKICLARCSYTFIPNSLLVLISLRSSFANETVVYIYLIVTSDYFCVFYDLLFQVSFFDFYLNFFTSFPII